MNLFIIIYCIFTYTYSIGFIVAFADVSNMTFKNAKPTVFIALIVAPIGLPFLLGYLKVIAMEDGATTLKIVDTAKKITDYQNS